MNHKIKYMIVLIISSHSSLTFSLIVGSNSAVQLMTTTTFPSGTTTIGTSNEMRGFTVFGNGVALPNASTQATWNAFFPIYGSVVLNNGFINLAKDLTLASSATFSTIGNINGNNYALNLPNTLSPLVINAPLTIGNASVFINSYLTLNSVLTFSNTCIVEGGNNIIDMTNSNGRIAIGPGSTVLLKDTTIKGISAGDIFCEDNLGTLSLQNVTWAQNSNYTFTQGALEILLDVDFTGTFVFAYQSTKNLKINSNSTMYFDSGMTFSYAAATNNLLTFVDNTSYLHLYETTLFANTAGLSLTKGNLLIEGACPVLNTSTLSASGILIGDGVSSANNLSLQIGAESGLNVQSGFLVYQNV